MRRLLVGEEYQRPQSFIDRNLPAPDFSGGCSKSYGWTKTKLIVTMNRIALDCLAAAEKIAATILLTCFMMVPAQTRAQEENDDHAFSLWPDFTHDTSPDQGLRVKDRVIAFFKQYLHD